MADHSSLQELKNRLMQTSFGPMDLVIYNTVCMSQVSLQLQHSHPYFEVHLPLKGNAVFHLDGEEVPVREGQVCWINPGVLRSIKNDPLSEVEHLVIHFDLLESRNMDRLVSSETEAIQLFLSTIRNQKYWVCEDSGHCIRYFKQICEEMQQKQFGYLLKVLNLLSCLIIAVIQGIGIQGIGIQGALSTSMVPNGYNNIAQDIVSYIRHHYQEGITLSSTARALNLSERHITRVLRGTFGTTFSRVLISFQIGLAKMLLCSSEDSLEQIAEKVGFSSVGILQDHFKRSLNMTVGQYRRQMKEKSDKNL